MRILVALCVMLALIGDDLCAAHFRDGEWLAENGVLESIRIEPLIPETGEGGIGIHDEIVMELRVEPYLDEEH